MLEEVLRKKEDNMKSITLKCNRCSATLSVNVADLFAGETVAILRPEHFITCPTCSKTHVEGEVIKRIPPTKKLLPLIPNFTYATILT